MGFVLLLAALAVLGVADNRGFEKSVKIDDGFELLWTIDSGVIHMGLVASNCSGWVAFGVSNQKGGGMTGGDEVMCTMTTQKCTGTAKSKENKGKKKTSHDHFRPLLAASWSSSE
jgi:hypothetical protein